MIPALLPMLWRESEMVAALSTVGAKALLTTAHVGNADHATLATRVAAALFSIRHVCAFGRSLPDGVTALDDVFAESGRVSLLAPREGNPAAHAAVVTFEPTQRGIQPVLRNHGQLIAGGLLVASAAEFANRETMLSAMPLSSFATLATTIIPWLLSGTRLVLHQPFDAHVFLSQARECDTIVLPGALVPAFAGTSGANIVAYWRAPERANLISPPGNIVDVITFGEIGLCAARRDCHGRGAPLAVGNNALPSHLTLSHPTLSHPTLNHPTHMLEAKRTSSGTLALRGDLVAKPGFPAPDSLSAQITDGFVDTGYPCRIEQGSITVTGPQPGMVGIGGYRIAGHDLDQVAAMTPFGIVSALPHSLLGQRLAGTSAEQSEVQAELETRGFNALVTRAFAHRSAA
jgi:non-ribosomal peptide synthetase component E (peptide arylation enzyme)